jgi:hypothetical protein
MTNKLDVNPTTPLASHPAARVLFRGLFFLVVIALGAAVLVPLGLQADQSFMKVFGH